MISKWIPSFLCLLLLFVSQSFSQEKEKEADINRTSKILFILEDIQDHSKLSLSLNSGREYRLTFTKNKHLIKNQKISDVDAKKLDEEYRSQYFSILYGLDEATGDKCKKLYSLQMRVEKSDICEGQKQKISKTKELKNIIKKNII